jgi:hypothetical protein
MSDITSMITGLATGLNQYLGTELHAQAADKRKRADIEFQQNAEYDRQSKLQTDQMIRQQSNKKFEQDLEGQVDAPTADTVVPGSSHFVNAFEKMNGRKPTYKEYTGLMKTSPKGQGIMMVQPSTIADLAAILGADEPTIAHLKGLKEPLPTGLATETLKNLFDKGLKETQVFSMYKDLNPSAGDKTPDQLGEEWIKFKTGIMEPGKVAITSDEEFGKIAKAAEGVVAKARADGKSPEQALAIGAQVVSKYDRKSKARLLFRIVADSRQNKQGQ